MKYDFDYMKDLYIEDPEKFEKYTLELIENFIESLPEKKRDIYRAKQWRIEQELKGYVSPIARMNKMISIFWDGVQETSEEYKRLGFSLESLLESDPLSKDLPPLNNSNVVDFKPKS